MSIRTMMQVHEEKHPIVDSCGFCAWSNASSEYSGLVITSLQMKMKGGVIEEWILHFHFPRWGKSRAFIHSEVSIFILLIWSGSWIRNLGITSLFERHHLLLLKLKVVHLGTLGKFFISTHTTIIRIRTYQPECRIINFLGQATSSLHPDPTDSSQHHGHWSHHEKHT